MTTRTTTGIPGRAPYQLDRTRSALRRRSPSRKPRGPGNRHGDHHVAHLRDGVGTEQREDRAAIRDCRSLLRHRPYLARRRIDLKPLGGLESDHVPIDLWSVTSVMSSSCSQSSPVKE
jgi:hypothetical protein